MRSLLSSSLSKSTKCPLEPVDLTFDDLLYWVQSLGKRGGNGAPDQVSSQVLFTKKLPTYLRI